MSMTDERIFSLREFLECMKIGFCADAVLFRLLRFLFLRGLCSSYFYITLMCLEVIEDVLRLFKKG